MPLANLPSSGAVSNTARIIREPVNTELYNYANSDQNHCFQQKCLKIKTEASCNLNLIWSCRSGEGLMDDPTSRPPVFSKA